MSTPSFYRVHNSTAVPLHKVPVVPFAEYRALVLAAVASGGRVVLMSGFPHDTVSPSGNGPVRVLCAVAWDEAGTLGIEQVVALQRVGYRGDERNQDRGDDDARRDQAAQIVFGV